ncbi:MAG: polyphosphate polymerase domain-containing protein [Bacteroidota bacterium]
MTNMTTPALRYERKFRVEGLSLADIQHLIRLHPSGFRTLYPDRQINNIYFDTPDLVTYRENVNGQQHRKKYRIRWYGKRQHIIQHPQFETKIKAAEVGTKEIHSISAFAMDDLASTTAAVNQQTRYARHLLPSLMNAYRRAYYISFDQRFRLTVDWCLRYHNIRIQPDFRQFVIQDAATILELKYDQPDDRDATWVIQRFPFRQSKHSKYVQGLLLTR